MKTKTLLGTMVIVLIFGISVAGCDLDSVINPTVPSWAQGEWYLTELGSPRIRGAVITSSQLIYYADEIETHRENVTYVSGNTVLFGIFTVDYVTATRISVSALFLAEAVPMYK